MIQMQEMKLINIPEIQIDSVFEVLFCNVVLLWNSFGNELDDFPRSLEQPDCDTSGWITFFGRLRDTL